MGSGTRPLEDVSPALGFKATHGAGHRGQQETEMPWERVSAVMKTSLCHKVEKDEHIRQESLSDCAR